MEQVEEGDFSGATLVTWGQGGAVYKIKRAMLKVEQIQQSITITFRGQDEHEKGRFAFVCSQI